MFVYRLNKSFTSCGQTYFTGDKSGILFASLASAQASVTGVEWAKRVRQNKWESDNKDLISRERVHP